ncbi:MAG: ATP-binding protein [Acidobacteria bacterium]|nr:ATP-binding protein [Acidobacteriota bacterium]
MTHRRSSSSPGGAAPNGRAPATPRIPACPDDAGQLHELVIELEPRKSFLNSVIQIVEKFGEEHGVPDGPIYRVNLEIDELLTNYVLHRLDRSRKARIEVRVRLFRDRLVLVFLDTGPPFDPRTLEPPPQAETLAAVSLGNGAARPPAPRALRGPAKRKNGDGSCRGAPPSADRSVVEKSR